MDGAALIHPTNLPAPKKPVQEQCARESQEAPPHLPDEPKHSKISSDILRALSGVHPDRTDATGERTARGCLTWPLSDRRVLRVTTTRVPGGNVLRFEVTSAQGLTHGRPPVDPAPGDGRHDLTSDGPHMS